MPRGLNRSGDFRNGSPITLPLTFGTPVNTATHNFGNPVTLPQNFGNAVTLPKNFGNIITPPAATTPTITPDGGIYTVPQSVTLSSVGSSAIYYTTDGSTPTTGSTLYTGAITVSSTETIKAIATAVGLANSAVASATFDILLTNSFAVFPTTATRNNFTGSLGWTFQVTAPITIEQFGRLYVAGNTQNHTAYLWLNSSQSLLTSATILAASSSDSNGFKYVSLATPYVLATGTQYSITIDETSGGDTFTDMWTPDLQPIFTTTQAVFSNSPGTYPTNGQSMGEMYDTAAMVYHT
jgi:hypothetical protein